MTLQGKGYFIWQIRNAEQGNANAIADLAAQANLSHVLIKIADGIYNFNVDLQTGVDLVPPVVDALRRRGIQVWGWHYIYGIDPTREADRAVLRVKQFNLDGYVLNAEAQYKQPGKEAAARLFMSRLRAGLPNLPVALSSYRYPTFHPQLPWQAFLEKCDYNMPQVYWMQSTNAGEQLARSVREFQAITPFRPIIPTGSAFKEHGWVPTPAQVVEFLRTAQELNLSGANFWEWANTRNYLPAIWDAIRDYPWTVAPPEPDILQRYIDALNTRDPNQVLALYHPQAVHVTAARTLQGAGPIRNWYNSLFGEVLPGGRFTLSNVLGSGTSRFLSWTATSNRGVVRNGSDTFGLLDGKIVYHYTFFTVV